MATTSNKIFRVRVSGDKAAVQRFLATHPIESQGVQIRVRLDLTVDARQREELVRMGLHIESQIDVHDNLLQRRKEVEPLDRFAKGGIPDGIGRLLK